jgi:hypothetical protein
MGRTDLERFRAEPPPRSAALCRRYALRGEGAAGYIIYGILWMFLALPAALGVALFVTPGAPFVGFALGSVVMWGLYLAGVHHQTAPTRRFLRDAILVDGQLATAEKGVGRHRNTTRLVLTFAHAGQTRSAHENMYTGPGSMVTLTPGSTVPILYLPDDPRVMAFIHRQRLRGLNTVL